MRALALSPHLDDATFSCGGTLATLARAGWEVEVTTVFTQTVPNPQGFALACQLDKGLSADVDYMALRRAEDADAVAVLGAAARWLPFPEAPHRGYTSAPALFAGLLASDTIVADLTPALAVLLTQTRPDLVLAPQAIGGHVDHVALVRALAALQNAPSVLWWTDYPYAIRPDTPAKPFGALMDAKPGAALTLDDDALNAKIKAARCYRSQIGFQFGGADALAERFMESGRVERFRVSGALPPFPGLLAAPA